jgi:hypothetical protein
MGELGTHSTFERVEVETLSLMCCASSSIPTNAVFEEWLIGACGKWNHFMDIERLNLTCERLPP